MADISPVDNEKGFKNGEPKQVVDVQSVPAFDENGPVEFEEKAELR